MSAWIEVKSAGQIPMGSSVILKYRINGQLVNGINGQPYTYSDALRALPENKVEYEEQDKNPAAVALGKLGGSVKSEKKAKSSAANGAKGGRPRTRKFWMVKNSVGAFNRSVIAITESAEGDKKARDAGYKRVTLNGMTEAERKCLRDYDQNNPTIFPAKYLG